jgi:ankyrin repeat protein
MYLRLKNETPPEKFTFVLIERGRRLFLCAKSKESRRDWIKSINSRLLKLDQILPDDIYGESPKQQNETLSNPAIMMSKLATFQKNTPRISTIGRMRAQSASLERKSSAPKPQVLKEKSLKGWLTQHYGVSRKLQRYFILKSRNLHVYHAVPQASESMKNLQKQRSDSLDNSDAISTFTVKDCTVTVLREENFEFGFRISSRLHKMSLYLSSFSKDERDQWLDALETEGALVIRVENEPCFQGELFLVSKRRHVLVSLNVSSVQIDGEDYSWESIFVHDSGNVIFMSFENRVLQLETESKEIHQLWLLKISFFLQAYYMLSKHSITSRIGWIHWFLRNSIHSYSYTGDFQGLKSYVSFLGDSYVHAIDSKDDEEYTAIHLACHQGHLEIVEYLIDLKASLLLKDPNGNPPAHIAAARADGDLLKLIIGKGGYHLYSALNSKDQKVLWALGFSGSPITKIGDSLKCISEIKCNIDEYDDASGLTLLQTAASANLYKILEILLQNGSDLSKLSKTGAQSIHLAAAAEAEEAMVILLKYGAQPNMKDVNGKSPLDHLPFNLDVDNPLAVLLTEHGARWDNSKEDRKRDLIALSPKLLKAEELYKDLGKAKGSLRATYFKEITLDSQSFCMICSSSFGALSPRRRCDHCGLIICVLCATKKYRELEKEDSKHTCCDGCFNKLRYLHGQAESRKSLGPLGFLKVPRYSFGERMVEKVNRMLK